MRGVNYLEKDQILTSNSIIWPELGSSGNAFGRWLKSENFFFRKGIKPTYFRCCCTPLLPTMTLLRCLS